MPTSGFDTPGSRTQRETVVFLQQWIAPSGKWPVRSFSKVSNRIADKAGTANLRGVNGCKSVNPHVHRVAIRDQRIEAADDTPVSYRVRRSKSPQTVIRKTDGPWQYVLARQTIETHDAQCTASIAQHRKAAHKSLDQASPSSDEGFGTSRASLTMMFKHMLTAQKKSGQRNGHQRILSIAQGKEFLTVRCRKTLPRRPHKTRDTFE